MAQSSAEVAYEVALRRLDSQFQRIDVIDGKVTGILGLASTMLGIFAGFIAVVVSSEEAASVVFAAGAGSVILASYLLVVWNALGATAIGDWDQRPDWRPLLDSAQELDLATMHLWVAEGCVASLEENEEKLLTKAAKVASGTKWALLQAMLIALALVGLFVIGAAA